MSEIGIGIYNGLGGLISIISIVACGFIAFSKLGKVEVAGNGKKWDTVSWICGIFIAGMGVALVCKVPSDLKWLLIPSEYTHLPFSGKDIALSKWQAIIIEGLCYNGIPVWCMYGLLSYWYSRHLDSKIGKIGAMLSTVIGMAISLKSGVEAIIPMISDKLDLSSDNPTILVLSKSIGFGIAGIMCIIALLSAKNNWLKKVSKSATFMFFVCGFIVLATGYRKPPIENISGGASFGELIEFYLFNSGTSASWYFWWISWSMTVARWVAKISVGRSTKSMILVSSILPSIICFIWTVISYEYGDFINGLCMHKDGSMSYLLPTLLFIITGIIFMSGTLDSDCKVFTEDLESITNGKFKQRDMMGIYCLFVMFLFVLWLGGILTKNGFNYLCGIFIPMFVIAIIDIVKEIRGKRLLNIK